MVTGLLLGLQRPGGCVLIEVERLLYLEKSLPYGIFVLLSAQLVPDMDYRAPTNKGTTSSVVLAFTSIILSSANIDTLST